MIRTLAIALTLTTGVQAQFDNVRTDESELQDRLAELRRAAERHALGLTVDRRVFVTPGLPKPGPTARSQLNRLLEQNEQFRLQLQALGVSSSVLPGEVTPIPVTGENTSTAIESTDPGDLSIEQLIAIAQREQGEDQVSETVDAETDSGSAAGVTNPTTSGGDRPEGVRRAWQASELFDGRTDLELESLPPRAAIPQLMVAALRADRDAVHAGDETESTRLRARREFLATQILALLERARKDSEQPVKAREAFAAARALELLGREDDALAAYAEVEILDRSEASRSAEAGGSLSRLAQFATDEILRRRRRAPVDLDGLDWAGFEDRNR
ncbi:MAG: hypothetical protein AAF196_07885 [Planctomycetota bacterium]